MAGLNLQRPEATEYAPYYDRYVSLVADSDVVESLNRQLDETLALLGQIPEAKAAFRYAPDKWSIKEVVGHMIDAERIFSYRALRFARNDKTPLNGFEQDDYIRGASFDDYTLADLASEFAYVRRASLSLFRHLNEEAWNRGGTASESHVSVRALAYIIAGHELHHMKILRDRYLQPLTGNPAS